MSELVDDGDTTKVEISRSHNPPYLDSARAPAASWPAASMVIQVEC